MRLFALCLILLLAACATQPITIKQAAAVPSSRVLAPQWIAQGPYTGGLTIKRDSGFMGSACTIRIFVDGLPVADLKTSEKVELFVPVGEHIVGATSPNAFCGGGTSETTVTIAPEREKILRIASGQSGDIHLQPSGF